jgi:hypothetical protein
MPATALLLSSSLQRNAQKPARQGDSISHLHDRLVRVKFRSTPWYNIVGTVLYCEDYTCSRISWTPYRNENKMIETACQNLTRLLSTNFKSNLACEALRHQSKVNATETIARRGLPQDEYKMPESAPNGTDVVKNEYPLSCLFQCSIITKSKSEIGVTGDGGS